MNQVRQSGKVEKVCDVFLKVEEKRISANRQVLSASSPFFKTMFSSDFPEATQQEVEIREVEEEALEALVNFCYTGDIHLDEENIATTLHTACFLQIDKVIHFCTDFLKARIDVNNCLAIHSLAESYTCNELRKSALEFVIKTFQQVCVTSEFLSLNFEVVKSLVSSGALWVSGEEVVWRAVVGWVRAREEERNHHFPTLFAQIRLPILAPEFLEEIVAKNPLVIENSNCKDLVEETRTYHRMQQRHTKIPTTIDTWKVTPRGYEDYLFAVSGKGNGEFLNSMGIMNCRTEEWSSFLPMSSEQHGMGVCVLNNFLYATGGYHGGGVRLVPTTERYNPMTNSWNFDVAPMNRRRRNHGATVLERFIYVCGGYDGGVINQLERFDPELNQWTTLAPMSTPRSGFGFVSLDGFLYAIGGIDGHTCNIPVNTVEMYNVANNQWHSLSSMSTKRYFFGCTVYQGSIYVTGCWDESRNTLSSVERYDPVKDEWSYVGAMKTERSFCGLSVGSGKLFVVGGWDKDHQTLNTVEVYDIVNNSWRFAKENMQSKRSHFGLTTMHLKESSQEIMSEL